MQIVLALKVQLDRDIDLKSLLDVSHHTLHLRQVFVDMIRAAVFAFSKLKYPLRTDSIVN